MNALRYGKGEILLPAGLRKLPVLAGEEPPPLPDPASGIAGALARPLGLPSLATFVEPGDRVVLVVPDATRYTAPELVLPPVVRAVEAAGASSITVRIANGTHRRSSPEELRVLAGGVALPVGDRDCDDPEAHLPLGKAHGLGTLRIDAEAARADKLVLVGTISFHYLAGFGGGGKLLAPGLADRSTALAIHRRCLADPGGGRHPSARPGVLEGNPLHGAIGELLAFAPPAFLVQVALQRGKRPAAVFAGDVREAHRAAAAFHTRYQARPVEPADLVIASAGGAPWDLNLYQAHKALEAACAAVRPGGTVILLAACPEGPGSEAFARSLTWTDPGSLESALRADFSIALHTALALRRKTSCARCILVSDGIDPALALGLGFLPAADLEEALRIAGDPGPRALVLPDGARTLPVADAPTAASEACNAV